MQPRQIFLFEAVTDMSAEYIVRQLLTLDRESGEEITMFINSPGGKVTECFAIVDTMRAVRSPIKTVVMGMAASCAAVIASNGKTRLITENSQFMLHEIFAFTMGSPKKIREDMERYRQTEDRLISIVAKNSNKSVQQIKDFVSSKDRYFSAQEAIDFGLCDKVIKDNEAQVHKLSEVINVEGTEIVCESETDLPEIEILREGDFVHPVYGQFKITPNTLETMKKNFDDGVRGIDISIDYTHDNDGGEKPAACWIKSVEVKDSKAGKWKVLSARVELTPKGRKLVQEKEYKYASADFRVDYVNERGKHFPYVLCGGTLTNRPFIKEMNPIKLSEHKPSKEENEVMNKQEMLNALKSEHGIDVTAMLSENVSLKAEMKSLNDKIRELSKLPTAKQEEIDALKGQLSKLEAEAVKKDKEQAFDKLLGENKVIPAQKEKILNAFAKAEEILDFYKDAPDLVNKVPAGGSGEATDETLTPAEQAVVNSGTFTREEVIAGRTLGKKKKAKK